MFKTLLPQILAILLMTTQAFAGEQEVIQVLSTKDSLGGSETTLKDLENLAGGKDQLISILLKYRREEKPPFVGIRAENLLLNYSDNEEVISALESDVNDANFFGLARTIGSNIDAVQNPSARQRLARAVVSRAKTEKKFESFGRMLKESSDSEVKRLAKDL